MIYFFQKIKFIIYDESHVSKFREILKGSSPSSNNNPHHHGSKKHDKEGIAKILCQRNKFLLS
jgi:hypothetical protein